MYMYDVDPLALLKNGVPSPPRSVPLLAIPEFDSLAADSEQLLPASPYGSAEIALIYSAAI